MSIIFGQRLREVRTEKKYTQQDIANLFNVSKMTISSWETNKQEPNIDDITRLCQIFNVSADYLLGLEDESGRKNYTVNNTSVHNNFGNINFHNK